jgi:ParB family chromosome partitioning protein
MTETKIENVSLDKIRPSKTNPRKHFNEQSLAELIESVSAHGIIQPLVVRPDWCIGKSAEEISKVNGQAPEPLFFEIVAGERRYRAAAKAKLETAPLSIRNFSDQEALEIQLIENLQRDDLDPFDEAAGYQELLNFRTSDGKAVHTVDTIHKRVGKKRSRIYQRLKLLKVPPAIREAVRGGLSVRIGEMVGALATKQMRAAAAAEVLKPTDPRYGVGPLTVLQAEDLIERNFSRSLSGADFDQKDPRPILSPVPSS